MDCDGDNLANLAMQKNRVLLTDNLKLFNKKISIPRGCLHYKAKPYSKYNLNKFIRHIDQFKALEAYFEL